MVETQLCKLRDLIHKTRSLGVLILNQIRTNFIFFIFFIMRQGRESEATEEVFFL